jgi:hypothetical protein
MHTYDAMRKHHTFLPMRKVKVEESRSEAAPGKNMRPYKKKNKKNPKSKKA